MSKTLLTRISHLDQYNQATKTVLWTDPAETRWENTYGKFQAGDNAIFIASDKLLIGRITQLNDRQSILCVDIQEIECSNDQFLQLHEIYPELISRVKANFQPFIHPQNVNIEKLIADINSKRFVSYYFIPSISNYESISDTLKENDRVVLLNANNQIENVKLHTQHGLSNFPEDLSIKISVEGLTLDQVLEKNKNFKRKSTKSNNISRIQKISTTFSEKGNYKFTTFFSYYDALFNKKVYKDGNGSPGSIVKIQLDPNVSIYKVSMSGKPGEINEEDFAYFIERNLIVVHGSTKPKGVSSESQGEVFSKQMKIGDYFYLCRGNSNMEIIGKIIGEANTCEYKKYGDDGWLQRSYEIVSDAVKEDSYRDVNKWWSPNNNSTCVKIPKNELNLANEKLFEPFFNTVFEYENASGPDIKDPKSFKSPLNLILFGPPGTGKTYNTINKAVSIIDGIYESELTGRYKNRQELKHRFNKLMIEDWDNPDGQIGFITFHQSMSYEDFVEGIKPDVTENQTVIYDIEPGIFKLISNIAKDNWLDAKKGNKEQLSFEDAFNNLKDEWLENQDLKFPMKREGHDYTILEFTKSSIRFKKASGGTGHTLSISTLRDYYYKRKEVRTSGVGIYYPALLTKLSSYQPLIIEEKKVKPYVLIIDEINRGNVSQILGELITLIEEDKRLGSDEAIEATLPYSKERFGVPPNLYIIGTMNTADRSVEALDTALRRRFNFEEMVPNPDLIATDGYLKSKNGILDTINLVLLLSTINRRIEKLLDKDHKIGHSYFMCVRRMEQLKMVFHNKIVPLLQEYFFGDFGKIGLVLGKGFFEPHESIQENVFADFDDYDASEFIERPIYRLKDISKLSDKDFTEAINLLLKL